MKKLARIAKIILPIFILRLLLRVYNITYKFFVYRNYDSSEYWKSRAREPGQAAVLWQNNTYNELYRNDQYHLLDNIIEDKLNNLKILDIGCGIGVVAKMLVRICPEASIDAVDFKEMILVAKKVNNHPRIHYIDSSAENYFSASNRYDYIVSSGCYSAIRDISKLKKSILLGADMLKSNGKFIMIDPFHKSNYLARAKFSTKDVENLLKPLGFKLVVKSGILFWPMREHLSDANLNVEKVVQRYRVGEKLLSLLGKHFWADYKILVFIKK